MTPILTTVTGYVENAWFWTIGIIGTTTWLTILAILKVVYDRKILKRLDTIIRVLEKNKKEKNKKTP